MLSSVHEEKQLVEELIKGSEPAFKKIYKLYSQRLFGNLLKLVKSESQAREILQDVFLKIWEHRESINPEKSFRSYLFKIAENKVYDFFRMAARDKKRETDLIAWSSKSSADDNEFILSDDQLLVLQKAIEALPTQRRQVFRLCKLEGKSYKEVSELLGISVSTISDHIVKGTKSVRDYMDGHNKELFGIAIVFYFLQ